MRRKKKPQDAGPLTVFWGLLNQRGKVEAMAMSLQMRGAGEASVRQELIGRINGLIVSCWQYATAVDGDREKMPELMGKVKEEAKALFHALTGQQPTGDEVETMFKF